MTGPDRGYYWICVALAAVGTLGIRFSFIGLADKWKFPESIRRGLKFIPASVLTAIVAPAMILHTDPGGPLLGHSRALAGLVAALVAWRTKNMLYTIAAGMACLWLTDWLVG